MTYTCYDNLGVPVCGDKDAGPEMHAMADARGGYIKDDTSNTIVYNSQKEG